METIVSWFAATLGKYISAKALIFIVSMIPILECRGGLVMASLLQVDIRQAIPICIIGNIIPIPFILLFIQKIFHRDYDGNHLCFQSIRILLVTKFI